MSTTTSPSTPSTRDGVSSIRPVGKPGDLGWVVKAHGELYAEQFGWNIEFETLVARIVADYAAGHDATRESAWIAEVDGERAGCVFLVSDPQAGEGTARLRVLLVDPDFRGHGLGARLVDTCVDFARTAGYRRITLWTNDVLSSARRIYEAAGFQLERQTRHHSFGHDLTGQDWTLNLD